MTNTRLYGPRLRFGSYLQRDSLLDPDGDVRYAIRAGLVSAET